MWSKSEELLNPWEAISGELIQPPKPNVELSFGAGDGKNDFLVYYRRIKPLNKFQIWMYKVCFGIIAKNI